MAMAVARRSKVAAWLSSARAETVRAETVVGGGGLWLVAGAADSFRLYLGGADAVVGSAVVTLRRSW